MSIFCESVSIRRWLCSLIPKGCPGHKTGRIPALLPINIFCSSIIGAKLKAEEHALWAALRSAACGGALRRCATPSAAARRFRSRRASGALRAPRAARAGLLQTRKKCRILRIAHRALYGTVKVDGRAVWPVSVHVCAVFIRAKSLVMGINRANTTVMYW